MRQSAATLLFSPQLVNRLDDVIQPFFLSVVKHLTYHLLKFEKKEKREKNTKKILITRCFVFSECLKISSSIIDKIDSAVIAGNYSSPLGHLFFKSNKPINYQIFTMLLWLFLHVYFIHTNMCSVVFSCTIKFSLENR